MLKLVNFVCVSAFFAIAALSTLLMLSGEVNAQGTGNPGNNAVFNSSSACCIGASAFIDASILFQADICATIYNILQPATYTPSVIDARGISGALTCANGRVAQTSSATENLILGI